MGIKFKKLSTEMRPDWKEQIINSLRTADMLGCGQSIHVLREVAGTKTHYNERQVSSYVRTVADYEDFTKVWVLKKSVKK